MKNCPPIFFGPLSKIDFYMQKLFFVFILLALLTSCATVPPIHSTPPDARQWEMHQQDMLSLSSWQWRGKVAMKNGREGGQADVFWKQTDEQNYEIKLLAPFGAGSSLLTADAQHVVLVLSDGETIEAENLEQILAEIPDWQFPVSGLRFWLFGIAAPRTAASRMSWNEQGYLTTLEQDGWNIVLQNYAPSGEYFLPRKIFMRRTDTENTDASVELKLLVREWILP